MFLTPNEGHRHIRPDQHRRPDGPTAIIGQEAGIHVAWPMLLLTRLRGYAVRTRLPSVLLTASLAAALSMAGATAASAATACGEQLALLRSDVVAVPITGGKIDKERAGLVKLVDDATSLADTGKTGDAIVKLTNLQSKVDELASAQRISAESAAVLTGDRSSASHCLAVEGG